MFTWSSRLIVVAVMLAFGVMAPVAGLAQEATPEGEMAAAGISNHIHTGTCEELGDVIAPLADLVFMDEMMDMGMDATSMAGMDATPMAGMMGESVPVAVATTEIELSLDDILAAPHAVNMHDPNDGSVYIACGNITGTPDEQGNLFAGIEEDSGSGLSGVVWLVDDGSGAGTIVTTFLVGEFESTVAPAMDESATPVG
ncbi:MAG: hypothetical protein M3464_22460 [Chloroflexota bacterium]|nr:hypothetical protein [Chloroflexota bacterium]